ncbi:hypothetical protein CGCA056_v001524 [Colletotrichum aenigma]|uniref:uncharacterized protein n=1 Tax=Colletotrichum aenigma TaxID=1215731 RepID=UPI001872AF51|nr:uncharacterized protein CGCA056_v001524 [Colletotrichum aenigma]KAF5527168.1 hypothetical protein CGCA056_v001524 [Colletotrichum aenigma]
MVDADVDIDPNRPRRVLAVAILFLCLTPIAVALRLYSKTFITRTVTSDDKLLCLLQAVFTVFLVTEILGVVHGLATTKRNYRTALLTSNVQYFFAGELLYLLTTILLKVCVGILLLRIAIVPTYIWILRALLLSTLVFVFLYLFLVAFQCRPVHLFWDEGPRTPGHCFSKTVVLGTTFTAATLNLHCGLGIWGIVLVYCVVVGPAQKDQNSGCALAGVCFNRKYRHYYSSGDSTVCIERGKLSSRDRQLRHLEHCRTWDWYHRCLCTESHASRPTVVWKEAAGGAE